MRMVTLVAQSLLVLLALVTTSGAAVPANVTSFSAVLAYPPRPQTPLASRIFHGPHGKAYRFRLIPERETADHILVFEVTLQDAGRPNESSNLLDATGTLHGYQKWFFAAPYFVHGHDTSGYGDTRTIDLPRRGLTVKVKVVRAGVKSTRATSLDPASFHFTDFTLNVLARTSSAGVVSMTRQAKPALAVAMLAGMRFAPSALTAGAATAATTAVVPRTTVIAWADCNYGLESLPTPALTAYLLTSDGLVMRTRAGSVDSEDVQAESAVMGPKRFRAVAEGIDRAFFDPQPEPDPTPTPTPMPGGLRPIGRTHTTDTRNARFAVRHGGAWTDWRIPDRDYTKLQDAAVWAAYAVAYDEKLVWHPAAPRANAFAVCIPGAPRDLMAIPKSASTLKQ